MNLQAQVDSILSAAVRENQCAGMTVLVRRNGEDVLYAQAGLADIGTQKPISDDSIFRLYSQSKPVTAAATMILVERGLIDLMD